MAFALTCHVAAATENPKSDKVMAEKSDRTALVDIAIETSRPQPAAGDGLGVSADIRNVSDSVIHIEGKEIDLVVPPELEGPGKHSTGWYAMLPTETYGNDPWQAGVDLNPGDSYKVFWTHGITTRYTAEEVDKQTYYRRLYNVVASELTFLFFPPGDYKIAVVCKYRPVSDAKADSKIGAYRTTTQTAIIHVAAPQFVILFGAALGGLLAYFILPQARARLVQTPSTGQTKVDRFISRALKEAAGIAGAILLSTMITILLSRISETQFLIKVTVADVWGAIAIGFVANYAGAKALTKLLGHYDSTDPTVAGNVDDAAARKLKEGRLHVRHPAESESASSS